MKVCIYLKTSRQVNSRFCQTQDLDFTSKLISEGSQRSYVLRVHCIQVTPGLVMLLDDSGLTITLFTF